MAAAVFLHNAIFAADPPSPPPRSARTPPSSHGHGPARASQSRSHGGHGHDRQLSSVSSITLQTSTSEHSYPTESLTHPDSSESSVYLDLLARQPTYPSAGVGGAGSGLSLRGDPVTARERRVLHERTVRTKLRRLRLAQRVLWTVIGGWATYNTVRYYVSAGVHPFRERRVTALVLGSTTAFCVACNVVSIIITVSAPHLGWYYKPRSKHVSLKGVLHYSSSLTVFAPALVNLVLVFLWRNPLDAYDSLRGRCYWDIDVVWSGTGGQCDRSPAWGFWLAGSIVRLLLTVAILIAYHAVSYKYMVTRRPSRRRRTSSIFRHSAASFPSPSTTTTASSRSFRPMATVSSPTVSASQASPSRDRSGSANDTEPHSLRGSRSRIVSPAGSKVVRRSVSAQGFKSASAQQPEPGVRSSSPSSSEGDPDEDGEHRYGRPVRRTIQAGGYASLPLGSPTRVDGGNSSQWDPVPDDDLKNFAVHFRALVEQVTRETDEGAAAATSSDDRYADFLASYSGRGRDDGQVVLGRIVHRMPTIESLGSHEVMSLASGGLSRPSTRSNTLSTAEAPTSRSASRANSLDAAVSLSVVSVDGFAATLGMPSEMGELLQTPSPVASTNVTLFGSRSTGTSYHTARSSHLDGSEEG